jgi:hypothetical protein
LVGVHLAPKELVMRLKYDNEVMLRKAEGLRRLSQAYSDALKNGTTRKVVSIPKKKAA